MMKTEIAVVGPELEEDGFWAVPLINDFLNHSFVIVQLKAKLFRPLCDTRLWTLGLSFRNARDSAFRCSLHRTRDSACMPR